MTTINFQEIQTGLASLDASAAHTASGATRPKVEEIFAPEQHAGALDPNVTIVLGARGAGKSFWAGVLGDDRTRMAAADAYPKLGLNKIIVRFGFTGVGNDGSVSRATIDNLVPVGEEHSRGSLLWRCVVLRALNSALRPTAKVPTINTMMEKYRDPEEWEEACNSADLRLAESGRKVVVVFDALDSIALDWDRLRHLTDALLEVAWSTRGYRSLRLKLFLRPDQMRDLGLRFVELPKLLAGATNLRWAGVDLYGMLFSRLGAIHDGLVQHSFSQLLKAEGIGSPPKALKRLRSWPLAYDRAAQARTFTRLAGAYMGKGHKKGRTYDWPLRHLADGHGEVTPRSFLTLMIEAARSSSPSDQAISAEGIRHGLREASKVRVNQLDLEFRWIKRVLVPLARLQVPCTSSQITGRWEETDTIKAVMNRARGGEFLPPFDPRAEGQPDSHLRETLVRIGVLVLRADGRYDMPDLFRVAARLLKKGGVAPS